MGTVNRMTNLLDKIERRLGVRYLINSSELLSKDHWAEVIMSDTMDTFSRYFPHKRVVYLNSEVVKYLRDGYYVINEELLDPIDIIGIGDIDWRNVQSANKYNTYSGGVYDQFANQLEVYQMGLMQSAMDISSLVNMGIYLEFIEPNQLKISGTHNANIIRSFKELPLTIYVKHKNLTTIAPTKMELFEKLAICDVAKYLLGELKYFDDYETNYGNINLRLDDLREEAGKRDAIIEELNAGYVNPANHHQPMILTI